ncbi:MAG: hypothetical protein Kow00129_12250 [Thermoleophilia bacterium]
MEQPCATISVMASPRVYVVDTNALLNDPEVVYFFSGAEVVVPAVVLKELDRLKRRGTDRRIRYHGRKATRLLFEASQNGRLIDGVPLANGSILRVDASDEFGDLPSDLNLERTDDIILAHAWEANRRPGVQATLVTNDLNMLLRAEALGIHAYRFEGKLDHLHRQEQSLMERLRQRRWTLLFALLSAVFLFSTLYLYATRPAEDELADLPIATDSATLLALGVSPGILEQHYEKRISEDPTDVDALVNLGNLLFDQRRYLEAVDYYRQSLAIEPSNPDVRNDMGIALQMVGHYEEAEDAFRTAIRYAPRHGPAYYNLGYLLARLGRTQAAVTALQQAIELAPENQPARYVDSARRLIADLESGEVSGTP